jgi:hypothetical protein
MTSPPNSQALSPPARDRSTSNTSPASMIRRGRTVETGADTMARIEG